MKQKEPAYGYHEPENAFTLLLAVQGPRLLLSFLFALLVCYTGTLAGAFSASPRAVTLVVTAAILIATGLCQTGRRGNRQRFSTVFWQRYLKLPGALLIAVIAWLACDLAALSQSTVRAVSTEVVGWHFWVLLVGGLLYCYTLGGRLQMRRVVAAILFALDLALLAAFNQYLNYWFGGGHAHDPSFHAQHSSVYSFFNDSNHFGVYLALVLPLALWDVTRATNALQSAPTAKKHDQQHVLARRYWNLWRTVRPGVMLGLCLAITSRSNWLAVLIGVGFLLLLKWRQVGTRAMGPVLRPYRPALLLALLLCAIVAVQQSSWLAQRLSSTAVPTDLVGEGRGVIWSNGLRMAMHRPWLGWGQGTFAINYPSSFRPDQFREPVLQAHNVYLNRFFEEGLPALFCWLALVGFVYLTGLHHLLQSRNAALADASHQVTTQAETAATPVAPRDDDLLAALLAGITAYAVCACFVMPEQLTTIQVHFYGYLAMVLALVAQGNAAQGVAGHTPTALRAAPGLARALAVAGVLIFCLHSVRSERLRIGNINLFDRPTLWDSLQAHFMFDEAMGISRPADRIWLLRSARDLDPSQPVYWAELGRARYLAGGRASLNSASYFFRAASHRAVYDAAWYHDTAMIYLLSGDPKLAPRAISAELHATKYDQTFALYQATLADAYDLAGQHDKAAVRRARARLYSHSPVMHEPIDPDPARARELYFTGVTLPRYRRIVPQHDTGDFGLVHVSGTSIENSLNGKTRYAPLASSAADKAAADPAPATSPEDDY